MAAKLVNVRLDPKRVRKAQMLREHGITLSDVLRQAIDDRFEALHRRQSNIDAAAVVRGILERHPDPAHLPTRDYNVHDRRSAQAAIRSHLKRTRP